MRKEESIEDMICRVHLIKEEEGGYSIYAAHLPGVISQGHTEEEALDNITEAFEGVFESYTAHNMPVPWLADNPKPVRGEIVRFVLVKAPVLNKS